MGLFTKSNVAHYVFRLKDFAVWPAHQGVGDESALIKAVENHIKDSIPVAWAVSLELISTLSAVNFYKGKDFKERPLHVGWSWNTQNNYAQIKR
ncbi:GNAT family N-acetyltransferase [Gemmiger sp.]|uniref:GNAT family N-acetyltransferase n=1 Tax=Gemmiger sp. TaxID=2049027 RepID=UPI002A908FEC|nr:GNAT family N-acetyltransferase [Gemmiger sp.]MDY5605452.1 GNAT family N-acetyltransferase [Gemmiger sp.]